MGKFPKIKKIQNLFSRIKVPEITPEFDHQIGVLSCVISFKKHLHYIQYVDQHVA